MDYPDIFSYTDYRPYLRDWFRVHRRLTGKRGTSAFSRLAGCVPGHVRNVVVGRRNLAPSLVPGFAQGLHASAEAAEYLGLLVRVTHPISPADQRIAEQLLQEAQASRAAARPPAEPKVPRRRVRSTAPPEPPKPTWTHPIIRALLAVPGVPCDATVLAASLRPAVSPVLAAAVLQGLAHQGWDKDHRPGPAEAFTQVRLAPQDPQSVALHREAVGLARWALQNGELDAALFRGALYPLPSEAVALIRAELEAFEAEVRRIFTAPLEEGEEMDAVYQVCVHTFPVSKRSQTGQA